MTEQVTEQVAESKSNVVPIRQRFEIDPLKIDSIRVNPAVVELLEHLVEDAKRGEIHAFVMVYTAPKDHEQGGFPARAYAGLDREWCYRHVIASGMHTMAYAMTENTWD